MTTTPTILTGEPYKAGSTSHSTAPIGGYKPPARKIAKDLKIDLIVDEDFMTFQDLAVEARHLAYVTKHETDYVNANLIDARVMLDRHRVAIERLTGKTLEIIDNDFIWVSHGWEALQGKYVEDTLIKNSRLSLFIHQHKENNAAVAKLYELQQEENVITSLAGTSFKLPFDSPVIDRTLRGMTIRDHARYVVIPV